MSCGNRCGGSCCGGCGSCSCCGDWGLLPGQTPLAFTLADAMLEFDKRYDKRYLIVQQSKTTDLADVAGMKPRHAQALTWDATAGKWIPADVIHHTQFRDSVDTQADLASIRNPQEGDLAVTTSDGQLWICDNTGSWVNYLVYANIPHDLHSLDDVHIPAPATGEVLTFDSTLGLNGQWVASPALHTLQFRASVANAAALSTIATPVNGDLALTSDNQHLQIYSAGAWHDIGTAATTAGKVQDGTAPGQFPIWDPALDKYVPAPWPIPPGTATGDILEWDQPTKTWKAQQPAAGIAHHMGTEDNVTFVTTPDGGVPVYDPALDEFQVRKMKLEELADVDDTTVPNKNDVLQWDDPNARWSFGDPTQFSSPITLHATEFGFSLFSNPANGPTLEATVKNMLGGVHVYEDGMLVLYSSQPNDVRYAWIDGSSRNENVVWDGASITRHTWGAASAITGVVLADGSVAMTQNLSLGGHKATNVVDPTVNTDAATKAYVDAQVARAMTGSLQTSVKAILSTPPAAPADLDRYIVGPNPTGAWAGRAADIAQWDAATGAWVLDYADDGDTRLVNADHRLYQYNGATGIWAAVGSAAVATTGVPVGSISMWPTLVPPANYLMCDGSAFTAAQYPELAAALGDTNLPDMRGYFVRGWSTDKTVDPNGPHSPGITSLDTTRMPRAHPFVVADNSGHQHLSGDFHVQTPNDFGAVSGAYPGFLQGEIGWGKDAYKPYTSAAGAHGHALTGGDEETRPKSITMAFIIRAKP